MDNFFEENKLYVKITELSYPYCDLCKEKPYKFQLSFDDGRPGKVYVCEDCMHEKYQKVAEDEQE